ncbi:MAG: hypothetical protein MZW92_80350 [Comamonadaceae bacterium]|nr:hypothetical protein [Comamonadaceae bacterium]
MFAQSSTTIIEPATGRAGRGADAGTGGCRHGDVGIPGRDRGALRRRHPGARRRPALPSARRRRWRWALAKAVLAFVLVLRRSAAGCCGRCSTWSPARRSAELFTLTVLFVSLAAACDHRMRLGLSMAFGAFLAGMMLGETEFRHQVEIGHPAVPRRAAGPVLRRHRHAVRPGAVPARLALGARAARVALLAIKTAAGGRRSCGWPGIDALTAWRTALHAGGRRRVRLRAARDRAAGAGASTPTLGADRARVGAAVDDRRAAPDPLQPRASPCASRPCAGRGRARRCRSGCRRTRRCCAAT